MNVIVYGVAKFLGYSAWGYFGYRLIHQKPSTAQTFSAGAKRWLIGLFVGMLLFFLVRPTPETLMRTYFAVYIPVRFFEWMALGKIVYKDWPHQMKDRKFYLWILGGIIVSFLIDMISPEMIKEGRFCVGRCLC
jgi:hypothetical protein